MNYFRTFLNSFRERVTSVKTYINILVFGDSSISGDIVHKPLSLPQRSFPDSTENDEDDVYYSINEEEEEFHDAVYYRWMYRMYLNTTKVVKYRRWTFVEYKTVLTRDRQCCEVN